MRNLTAADLFSASELKIIVGVSRHDNPRDVDEAYGEGTYARLFPEAEEEESDGPDPYRESVETQLEMERRREIEEERKR
jgi:hypothetical protein